MIRDVISRKPIADITSADETSTEVQAVFNRALRKEGLDDVIEQRNPQSTPPDPDSDAVPVLLALIFHRGCGCGCARPRKSPSDLQRYVLSQHALCRKEGHLRGER